MSDGIPHNAAFPDVRCSSGEADVSRKRPHERILISADSVRAAESRRDSECEGPEAESRQRSPVKRETAMLSVVPEP